MSAAAALPLAACGNPYRVHSCGAAAHPCDSFSGAHGRPVLDTDVRMALFEATDTNRGPHAQISPTWTSDNAEFALPDASFRPGRAHVLVISGARDFQALVTVTSGFFEDFGRYNTGLTSRGWPAVGCDGQRVVSVRGDRALAHTYVWHAPNASSSTAARDGGSASGITFDATVAYGETDRLRRAPTLAVFASAAKQTVELNATPAIACLGAVDGGALPHEGTTPPTRVHRGFDALTCGHAWLAVAAFVVAFPLSALSGRHKRPAAARATSPAAAPPPAWLSVHKAAALLGCACALTSLALMEAHKVQLGFAHLHSWHAKVGAAAYALAVAQPLLGAVRPAKGARWRAPWLLAHRAAAAALLGAGTYAAVTGVQKVGAHGVDGARGYEAAVYAALIGLAAWAAVLEARGWRRAARAPPPRCIVEHAPALHEADERGSAAAATSSTAARRVDDAVDEMQL